MRTKHPDSDAVTTEIAERNTFFLSHIAYPQESFDERERLIYQSVRVNLVEGLQESQKNDVLFLALVERIARTCIFLDKMEREFLKHPLPLTSYAQGDAKSDYLKIMEEHRKSIELLAALKGSDMKKGRVKIMEELRRTVQEA